MLTCSCWSGRISRMAALMIAANLIMAPRAFAIDGPPARYEHLGSWHRAVTTSSAEAQSYFDQGLTLAFAFNHEEAIRFFQAAAALDSSCAMAEWGVALCAGPNINNPQMDENASKLAWEALALAQQLSVNATSVEKDLIAALAQRYTWPPPPDRTALNTAYAGAMREVWRRHANDADVGALFAESLMDLRPWDLWSHEGAPRPETPEIVETLQRVLASAPLHPGANHYMIHTMEASPTPDQALEAANRLRDLVPDAGHLVHMPAHIDIRLGHYADAIEANEKAIATDTQYLRRNNPDAFYNIYRAHNYHFLAYAAMFDGQKALAMKAAREMVEQIPPEFVRAIPDFAEGFLGAPIHVMVRFGLWKELLAEPAPPPDYFVTTAFWHYGRTMAFAATGRVREASKEFAALRKAVDAVPESRLIGNNTAGTILQIGLPLAEGELEYRRGHHDRAFQLLRLADERDRALTYDEPWGWMMPASHALGALLLEQGEIADAEAVYRKDLALHPGNGWALQGLEECLTRSERSAEAAQVEAELRTAWARSDIVIRASCFCRRGGKG